MAAQQGGDVVQHEGADERGLRRAVVLHHVQVHEAFFFCVGIFVPFYLFFFDKKIQSKSTGPIFFVLGFVSFYFIYFRKKGAFRFGSFRVIFFKKNEGRAGRLREGARRHDA